MRATPLSRWVHLLVLGAFAGLLAAPALVLAQGTEPTTSKTTTATSTTKHHQMSNEDFDEHVNKIAEKLKLSDDQKEKFKTIMSAQRDKMKDIRAKYAGKGGKNMSAEDKAALKKDMQDLQADTDTQLASVLTPEQLAEYKKMRSEKMGQAKHKMESMKKS
jgi:Spy/CpxP family protein refolding chaperone